MELRDLAWVGPAAAVLTAGLGYLFAHRRRAPRPVRLALVAIVVTLLVFAFEMALLRRLMNDVVWPAGGLLGLAPGDVWTAAQAVVNTVKAAMAGLLMYAVVADRPAPPTDDE